MSAVIMSRALAFFVPPRSCRCLGFCSLRRRFQIGRSVGLLFAFHQWLEMKRGLVRIGDGPSPQTIQLQLQGKTESLQVCFLRVAKSVSICCKDRSVARV